MVLARYCVSLFVFPANHVTFSLQEAEIRKRRAPKYHQRVTHEHRINHHIRIPLIRVIDPNGEQLGVMSPDEGRDHARAFGLDLVEVAPNVRPPVCKIMDYGKYRYKQSKRRTRNRSRNTQSKTLRIRPNISQHDLDTKLNKAVESLEGGDRVQWVVRMRGRERYVSERWIKRLNAILDELQDRTSQPISIIRAPTSEGFRILAIVESAGA